MPQPFMGPPVPTPTIRTPFGPIKTSPAVPVIPKKVDPTLGMGGGMVPSVAGHQEFLNNSSAGEIPPVRMPQVTTPPMPAPGGFGESTNPVFGWQPGANDIRSSDNNQIVPLPVAGPPVPRPVPQLQQLVPLRPRTRPFSI